MPGVEAEGQRRVGGSTPRCGLSSSLAPHPPGWSGPDFGRLNVGTVCLVGGSWQAGGLGFLSAPPAVWARVPTV